MSNDSMNLEFGLETFGDRSKDAAGEYVSYPQVIRDVVEEGKLADRVGVDFFGIGEHHRDDFAVSAPDVVLTAIAVAAAAAAATGTAELAGTGERRPSISRRTSRVSRSIFNASS